MDKICTLILKQFFHYLWINVRLKNTVDLHPQYLIIMHECSYASFHAWRLGLKNVVWSLKFHQLLIWSDRLLQWFHSIIYAECEILCYTKSDCMSILNENVRICVHKWLEWFNELRYHIFASLFVLTIFSSLQPKPTYHCYWYTFNSTCK